MIPNNFNWFRGGRMVIKLRGLLSKVNSWFVLIVRVWF